jgi:hypothetical protein
MVLLAVKTEACMNLRTALLSVALAGGAATTAAPVAAQLSSATTVSFRNDLPGTYQLEHVSLWVDGALRYDGARPFDTGLPPGDHVVSVVAQYRLEDPVFTYVRGYRVTLRAAQRVSSDRPHPWVARAVQVGGVTTPVERRANIVWR